MPPLTSAHVCSPPAVMARTPVVSPETWTGMELDPPAVPLRRWAVPFQPQHLMPPLTSAHVSSPPAVMARTPEVRPETWTGMELDVVELFPSWPAELSPQHWTPPLTSAHVCPAPATMACTPEVRPETWTGTE